MKYQACGEDIQQVGKPFFYKKWKQKRHLIKTPLMFPNVLLQGKRENEYAKHTNIRWLDAVKSFAMAPKVPLLKQSKCQGHG